MFAATWLLAVCVGASLAAPHGTVVKAVSLPAVKTVSVTHEVVQDPTPVQATETFKALDNAGSSVATFVGNLFTNLGTFLSETIRTAPKVRKVFVQQQPVVKRVVVEPQTPPAHDTASPLIFQKTKTVSVH
ncbi:uncharacterized protein [Panulirus ornatus]|uniref:uncharacterized protein isoform X2 n=1 Tax=Panulirus ornatus TaxID=150431 RepID=UPI003A89027E